MKEETCRYGHQCTSGCGNDYDCPCQSDHCCALTENCEGEEYCDDHFVRKIDGLSGQEEQLAIKKIISK